MPRIARQPSAPLALVYRRPGTQGISEAAARLLRKSSYGFEVKYVGPKEDLKLTAKNLGQATLFAQPGSNGSVDKAFLREKDSAPLIQGFVREGGRYLGICMGGYLAGSNPGFDLLPGDSRGYVGSSGATVKNDKDTEVQVDWGTGDELQRRWVYFQDGPYFKVDPGAQGVRVLARYTNGKIAALAAPYGKGEVAVVGPHPEAPRDWFDAYGLPYQDTFDLGQQLIDAAMNPATPSGP